MEENVIGVFPVGRSPDVFTLGFPHNSEPNASSAAYASRLLSAFRNK